MMNKIHSYSMKRSLPPDFDPVYPYGRPPFNIMPPFYSSDGFVHQPTTVLSLKTQPPFSFDSDGNLIIKLGGGLTVNQDGELQSASATTSVRPPLVSTGGTISLTLGDGLEVSNDSLTIKIQPPLQYQNGALTLPLSGIFNTSNNTISLNVGQGLDISNDILQLLVETCFTFSGGKLSLQVSDGLSITNALSLNVQPYFSFSDNKLSLNTGNGLQTTATAIALKADPVFSFEADGTMNLQLDRGLSIVNNSLGVNYGLGLYINDSNALFCNIRAPLNYNPDTGSIGIQIGNGLGSTGTSLGASLYVKTGPGLYADSTNLRPNLGAGLHIINNGIETNLSNGLTFNTNRAVTLNLGRGLTFNSSAAEVAIGDGLSFNASNQIQVNLGSGLTFSNGAITSTASSSIVSIGTYIYNYQVAFTWEIIPTQYDYYIYNLYCTGFATQRDQTQLYFTPTDETFKDFFNYINYMYTTVQMTNPSNNTVTHIPLRITYSNSSDQLQLTFSSTLTAGYQVAPWKASVVRYKTVLGETASFIGPEW